VKQQTFAVHCTYCYLVNTAKKLLIVTVQLLTSQVSRFIRFSGLYRLAPNGTVGHSVTSNLYNSKETYESKIVSHLAYTVL